MAGHGRHRRTRTPRVQGRCAPCGETGKPGPGLSRLSGAVESAGQSMSETGDPHSEESPSRTLTRPEFPIRLSGRSILPGRRNVLSLRLSAASRWSRCRACTTQIYEVNKTSEEGPNEQANHQRDRKTSCAFPVWSVCFYFWPRCPDGPRLEKLKS